MAFSTLWLPVPLHTRILELAWAAAPLECVGLLAGPRPGLASAVYPLRNVDPEPGRRFLAEPSGLVRALGALEREGLVLVGIYHSHPLGPARPSGSDLEQAAWEVPAVIVDAARGEVRAFLLLEGGREVRLELV